MDVQSSEMKQWLKETIDKAVKEAFSSGYMEEDPSQIFYNAREAAAFIEDAMPTFYKRISAGEIPTCGGGKKIFVRKSDLLFWLNQNRSYSKEQLSERAIDNMRKRRKP
jgi:hypothetical protein